MKPSNKRRRRRARDFDEEEPFVDDAPRRSERPPSKKRRRWIVLPLLLLAFVAALPTVLLKTPLRDVVISRVVVGSGLRVSLGGASGGWVTPITFQSLQVSDVETGELFAVESVRSDRSLGALLLDSQNLGSIEVVRPRLRVAVRPDGSNVEDAIARLSKTFGGGESQDAATQPATVKTTLAINIADGVLRVEDGANSRAWELGELKLSASLVAGGLQSLDLSGQLTDSATPGASGRVAATLAPPDEPHAPAQRQLSWQLENAALAAGAPWLRRFLTGAELDGVVSGQGEATWTAGAASVAGLPGDFATSGGLAIDQLDASAAMLAGDRLRLARVELPWRLKVQSEGLLPNGVVIEELQLRSDVGRVAVRGLVDPQIASVASAATAAAASEMGQHEIELRGEIDLARMATMLPRALRIRADTAITSGTIEIAAKRMPAVNGDKITASLRTTALAATSGGKALRWEQPIQATASIERSTAGVRLESLVCQSEFLAVNAAGTVDEFTAAARFDLNRLANQLGQFIELNGIELAGSGEASGRWQLAGGGKFAATAGAKLNQLQVGLANGSAWTEPALELTATANGSLDTTTRALTRVEQARVKIVAQGDQLESQLAKPVAIGRASEDGTQAEWQLTTTGNGSIERWLARVRPWVDTAGWRIDGDTNLAANVAVAGSRLAVSDLKLSIANLNATSAEWSIQEPRVEASGDLTYDMEHGAFASQRLQFVTSAVAAAAQDVSAGRSATGGFAAKGSAAFRGDLGRLGAWRTSTVPSNGAQPAYSPAGQFTGNIVLAQQGDTIRAEISAKGENMVLSQSTGRQAAPSAGGSNVVWQEPSVTLHGLAEHDLAADRLTIQQLQIQSNTLAANVDGRIDKLSTEAAANLNGALNYDLAQVTPLLRATLGEGISLTGRETARFAVAGKLLDESPSVSTMPAGFSLNSQPSTVNSTHWSRRVQARVELPWSGANVYGLPIGGGKLVAALGDGGLRVDPISLAVAEGRLTSSPQVRFDPPPSELTLPAGPLLTDVRISPQVSEAMLKYIAPVLSGATESDGKFSLTLAGARVPLENARQADVGGQLTVHSVRMVPGEMARQWIALGKQIGSLAKQGGNPLSALGQQPQQPAATSGRDITLLSIRDQQVNFRVMDGRVHHENMEFQVEDVVLRSSGSVGFDETISLMLTVPIQDRWIERQPVLAGLRGQSLQIPITGTLRQPRMDQSALAKLSAQLLQGAAGQAVGNEVNRALDKLFGPR